MTDCRNQCEATRDLAGLLIASDVVVPELSAARDHLGECAECRKYLKLLQDDEQELMDFASTHEQWIEDLKVRTVNVLPQPAVRPDQKHDRWRWIMATGTRRLAAAAAVLVFLVVFLQGTDPSFKAWAEVIETVRQATSSRFHLRDMAGGDVEARQVYSTGGTSHRTFEKGQLVEAMYVDFEQQEVLYMAYPLKLAIRMKMTAELVKDFQGHDPAETFNFLQEYQYKELGTKRIDGRKAVGIRVTDARFLAERMERAELELWVDPETKLPIRFDVRGEVDGSSRSKHIRFYDFTWNDPVPESEFHPEVPDDFRITEGVELAVDQEHCLEGLRIYAKVVGRYPNTLAYESLKEQLWGSSGAKERDVRDMIVDMFRIRMASTFYGNLVRDEMNVVYFGNQVRPGQKDRVLMRWKVGPDQYRVIFGDLQTATFSGEQLLEMEGR